MAKVLLVEDNEMNRDMLSRRLVRKGFEVVIAVDGAAGVRMAGTANPDIILMDMSLPVIDGWQATRQIKSAEATRGIPVIALTAHAMASDQKKALAAGCDDFDTKPVDIDRLLGKMEALLKGKAEAPAKTEEAPPPKAEAAPAAAPAAPRAEAPPLRSRPPAQAPVRTEAGTPFRKR